MELRTLTPDELKAVYNTHMKRAFPPQELKPLSSMEQMRQRNCYEPLGLLEDGQVAGYACLWLAPGVPFALLDYLGTVEGRRNGGLGARILDMLAEQCRDYRAIFGEAEGPFSPDPEEAALQRRRLGFYRRNGFRFAGYDCALFGVHYRVLYRGKEKIPDAELMAAHKAIYQNQFSPEQYRRFIQIPLAPGEAVKPVTPWVRK